MTATPEIAVVVPTHQRRALLVRVLAALANQSLARERYEVVVVCDGCTDGSAAAARAAAGQGGTAAGLPLRVLEQENAGAASARNRGASASGAPLLLFLDDDMIADRTMLEAHVNVHGRSPGGLVLGAIPVHPDSPRSFLSDGLARWAARRDAELSRPGAFVPATEVLTGQLSLSRTAFDRLGGFDVRFTKDGTFGGEDIEFGWRARQRGVPILYAPGAISRQVYVKSVGALARDIREGGSADARLAILHPEIAPELTLGRAAALPPWERRAFGLTCARPILARLLASPLLAALGAAATMRLRGRRFEHALAVARAHLYALGVLEERLRLAPRAPVEEPSRRG